MSTIIKHSYFYKVQPEFSMNLFNINTLYKPIIGNEAYLLLLEMLNDSKYKVFNSDGRRSLFDLWKKMNFSFETFEDNRKILEAIGLLSTYIIDNDEKEIKYYFCLNHPLEYNAFISNNKLKKLLSLKLSSQKFSELEFIFNSTQLPINAKNISANIDDIFALIVADEYHFNFEQLYSSLSSLTSKAIVFSDGVKNIINSFYKNFSLSINEIELCCLDSIVNVENTYRVDEVILEEKITTFFNNKTNLNYNEIIKLNRNMEMFIKEIDSLELQKIFLDYKNISPEQYLTSINRQQLDHFEISFLKTMKRDYNLSNPSINILMDFSLRKTNGTLNLKYIKKVAKSISVSNLESVEEIYKYLYNANNQINTYNKNKTNIVEEKTADLVYVDYIF
ncbi:MAG: DnaD domain protein [Mycoplasmoidaceae bacterium]